MGATKIAHKAAIGPEFKHNTRLPSSAAPTAVPGGRRMTDSA